MDYAVDLVYLWVDGSDPEWARRKNEWLIKAGAPEKELAVPERWQDNDELKYSLRSVEMFVPWINHIYIVTDRQRPRWLVDSHPRVKIVDHREIIPAEYLPFFSSDAIESFLPCIPGLSEHFLFANDDMFFGRPMKKEQFFDRQGNPVALVKKLYPADFTQDAELCSVLLNSSTYASRARANILVSNKFGVPLNWENGHVIDPYRKSYMLEALADPCLQDALHNSRSCHFRSPAAIQRIFYSLYDFCMKRTTLKDVKKWKELRRIFAPQTIPMYLCNEHDLKKCLRIRPNMFCYYVGDYYEALHSFFEEYFPIKSSFER